jgi:hypothetical protein
MTRREKGGVGQSCMNPPQPPGYILRHNSWKHRADELNGAVQMSPLSEDPTNFIFADRFRKNQKMRHDYILAI